MEPPIIVIPMLEGVTTVIVGFVLFCVIVPSIVKNKPQFYVGFICILLVILLHALSLMIRTPGFQVFAGLMTGLLQLLAIVAVFLSAGGITVKQLGGELARAYEVIRRGEEEKEIIIPRSGEMPKQQPEDEPPGRVELEPQQRRRDDDTKLPLE